MVIAKHIRESGLDVQMYKDGQVIIIDEYNNHITTKLIALRKVVVRLQL